MQLVVAYTRSAMQSRQQLSSVNSVLWPFMESPATAPVKFTARFSSLSKPWSIRDVSHERWYPTSQTSARPPKENPPTTALKAGSEGLIPSNLPGPVLTPCEAGKSDC